MNAAERLTLVGIAHPLPGEVWADLGCGTGAFTLPLAAELGPAGRVLAIDRDASALSALRRSVARAPAQTLAAVDTRKCDIDGPLDLPELDGALFANVLHYSAAPAAVLRAVSSALAPGGRLVIVEYDRVDANRWVPFPLPITALSALAINAGIAPFELGARVRSDFGRELYVAMSRKAP